MNYSVTKVFTTQGCDLLIEIAEAYLDRLHFKKSRQESDHMIMSKAGNIVEADINTVMNDIDSCETVLECMPDGILINDTEVDLEELQQKLLALESGSQGYGILILLKIEHSIACLGRAIVETMSYINGLRARKQELHDTFES